MIQTYKLYVGKYLLSFKFHYQRFELLLKMLFVEFHIVILPSTLSMSNMGFIILKHRFEDFIF